MPSKSQLTSRLKSGEFLGFWSIQCTRSDLDAVISREKLTFFVAVSWHGSTLESAKFRVFQSLESKLLTSMRQRVFPDHKHHKLHPLCRFDETCIESLVCLYVYTMYNIHCIYYTGIQIYKKHSKCHTSRPKSSTLINWELCQTLISEWKFDDQYSRLTLFWIKTFYGSVSDCESESDHYLRKTFLPNFLCKEIASNKKKIILTTCGEQKNTKKNTFELSRQIAPESVCNAVRAAAPASFCC